MIRIRYYCGLVSKDGERVNPGVYRKIMDEYYRNYTEYQTMGVWEGHREDCIIFEVITSVSGDEVLTEKLRKEGNQSCILVTDETVNTIFWEG